MSIIKTFNNITNNLANPNLGPENLDVTPVQASGCMLWLDSSDSSTVILDGNNKVSQWNDKSGNGFNAVQPTEANRPSYVSNIQNSSNSILFNNNSGHFLNTSMTGKMAATNQSYTVFIAFQRTQVHAGANTSSVLLGGRTTGCFSAALYIEQHTAGLARLRMYVTGPDQVFSSNMPSPKSGPLVATLTKQGGNLYSARLSSIDNFTNVTSNNSSAAQLLFNIGSSCNGGAPFGGYIYEILLFDYVMSDDEKLRWEKYLSDKWGLGIYKPISGHPDVKNWIDRVYTNSGTLSQKTVDYVTDFCYEIDNAGLRNKFIRLNLLCGNNIQACSTPLYIGPNQSKKFGFNSDLLSYTGSNSPFTNSDYIECGSDAGLTSRYTSTLNNNNGPGLRTGVTIGRIEEFLHPQNIYSRSTGTNRVHGSLHLSVFCKELRFQRATGRLLGAYTPVLNESRFGCGIGLDGNRSIISVGPFIASNSFIYDGADRGLYLNNTLSSNTAGSLSTNWIGLDVFAGKSIYNRYSVIAGPFPNPATDIEVFCENRSTTTSATPITSSSLFRSVQTLQSYSIGLALTELEVETYYTILNKFQNKLGRGLQDNINPGIIYDNELVTNSLLTVKGDGQVFTIFRDSTTSINLNNFATVENGAEYRIVWHVPTNRGGSLGAQIRQLGSTIPTSPSIGTTTGWGSAIFTAISNSTVTLAPPNAGVNFDLDYLSLRKITRSNLNTTVSATLDGIIHPDARNWLLRVYENGGTVGLSTATAVQNFCNSIDSAGLRNLFYRLNLFCGDNLRSCLTPLYRGPNLNSPYGYKVDLNFINNFLDSDYNENSGLQGDGLTKGLFTGVLTYDLGPNVHLSTYLTAPDLINHNSYTIAGINTNEGGNNQLFLRTSISSENPRYQFGSYLGTVYTTILTSDYTSGFYIGSALDTTAKHYKNGIPLASTSSIARTINGSPITVFCGSEALSDKPINISAAKLGSYSCGLYMTDEQASAFNTIMQTFQAALGRNV